MEVYRKFVGFDKAVVLDVETTGLEPGEDRVVSIAALRLDFPEVIRTGQLDADIFDKRVNPGVPIPAEVTAIHGISDADIANAPSFADVAHELRELIGDLPIIGHHVQFDKRFLNAEFKRAGVKGLGKTKSHCTQQRMKEHLGHNGQGFRKVSLEDAAQAFGLSGRESHIHDAMEDAKLTAQIAAAFYARDNDLKLPAEKKKGRNSALMIAGAVILAVLVLFALL